MSYMSPFFIPTESPKLAADVLRTNVLGTDPQQIPIDLNLICEYLDLKIIYKALPEDKLGKRELQRDGTWAVIINEKIKNNDFLRSYTIAHEAGHTIFKTHCDEKILAEMKDIKNPFRSLVERQIESQADQFAAELLMPEVFFKKDVRAIKKIEGWDKTISALSNKYKTSIFSTGLRFVEFSPEIVAFIAFRLDSTPYSLRYSDEFKENKFYIPRDNKIPEESQANEIIKGNGQSFISSIPVDVWCQSYKNNRQRIFEHSKKFQNRIYSILWVEKLLDY